MTSPVHILGFAGSLRKDSYNVALLRNAAALLPDGATLELFDPAPIPLFNQDLEGEVPEGVRLFRERIRAADALLIASPEYNYSITGVLKNAIDWGSRPQGQSAFDGKPVAIMGAGGRFGTVRSQLHLRQILAHLNMYAVNRPEVFINEAWKKFDTEGNLTDDDARDLIRRQLGELVAWTRRLRRSYSDEHNF
jgi:chromate reductase